MNRSNLERLRDAREYAEHALYDAGGLSAEILAGANQPLHAALYDLAVVGETLNKVSSEVKGAAPDLPWKAIADLRNLIIHAYWQIDLEIIAYIIEFELEPLIAELDKLLAFVERTDQ
jgi:uncharacterized protein with HEPN domain